jgi:hypothetical protein
MDGMRRVRMPEWEAAAARSAEAVGRREKTLAEHELYVEALLAGDIVPGRPPRRWRGVALASGVTMAVAGALVGFVAAGDGDRAGDARRAKDTSKRQDRSGIGSLSTETRLEGALKRARQEFLDATFVTRAERKRKPDVTSGDCRRTGSGRYQCSVFHERIIEVTPKGATSSAVPVEVPLEGWTTDWNVTLDSESCWTAIAVYSAQSEDDDTELAPLEGCLGD